MRVHSRNSRRTVVRQCHPGRFVSRHRHAARGTISAELLGGWPSIEGEAFSGAQLIEYRRMAGKDLRVQGMNETIDFHSGWNPPGTAASPRNEAALTKRFDPAQDWHRRFGASRPRHIDRTELGANCSRTLQHDAIVGIELIEPPQEGVEDRRRQRSFDAGLVRDGGQWSLQSRPG